MSEVKKEEAVSFEEAMARLEAIVDQMESGELPLEEILVRYEEGTKLVRQCSSKLAAAGKRIEMIARNAAGEPEVTPFDAVESASDAPAEAPRKARSTRTSRASAAAADDVSEDVSLF